jgi:hypothetical protein
MELVVTWVGELEGGQEVEFPRHTPIAIAVLLVSLAGLMLPPAVALLVLVGWLA